MSLVTVPLSRREAGRPAALTTQAMEVGQYVIAALLTVIGVVRAIGDGASAAATVAVGVAVLAWHVAGTLLAGRGRSRASAASWLVGFVVVWGAAVWVSAEFVWLAFLLWLLAGHLLPLVWGLGFSVLVYAVVVLAPILHHGTTSYANVLGPLVGGVFAFAISRGYLQLLHDATERERLVASLTQAQHEMAVLQDELARTQRESGAIAERTRISRDLHDTVAQSLSSIRLIAHAERGRTDEPSAKRTLTQVDELVGESLADVRRIVAALAPAELENGALAAALQRMLDRLAADTGIRTELRVDDSVPALPSAVEVALLRTAQSAIGNVRTHAGADRVVVSLIDDADGVRLDIRDDGSGFDVAAWEASGGSGSSSYGLRFMRARLRELGGGIDVESAPGEGTALSVHVPVRAVSEEDS